MSTDDTNEVHAYDAGRNEYRSRPRNVLIVMRDGRVRCGSAQCDGSCNASERVNDGAEGFLRRLRGSAE